MSFFWEDSFLIPCWDSPPLWCCPLVSLILRHASPYRPYLMFTFALVESCFSVFFFFSCNEGIFLYCFCLGYVSFLTRPPTPNGPPLICFSPSLVQCSPSKFFLYSKCLMLGLTPLVPAALLCYNLDRSWPFCWSSIIPFSFGTPLIATTGVLPSSVLGTNSSFHFPCQTLARFTPRLAPT